MFLLGLLSGAMIVEAVTANTLFIPDHSPYSLPVELPESSIISDAEIAGQLDYLVFGNYPRYGSNRAFQCYDDCPVAVVDSSDKGYKLVTSSSNYSNNLELFWSADNDGVFLNEQVLLDNNMKDLHQPQYITQNPDFTDSGLGLDLYTGPIPITYSVKVVQAKNVQFEDGSFAGLGKYETVQFFSIDFNVVNLDDHYLTSTYLGKVNIHVVKRKDGALAVLGFMDVLYDEEYLDAVSLPDSSATSSTDTLSILTYAAIATTGASSTASELSVSTTAYDTMSRSSYTAITPAVVSSTVSVLPISTTALVLVPSGTAAANHSTSSGSDNATSPFSPSSVPFIGSAAKVDSYLLNVASGCVLLVFNLVIYLL